MRAILSNPSPTGWCKFTSPSNPKTETPYVIRPSYVTDVMDDTLNACINYLKEGIGVVNYDCENNGEWLFIINDTECFLVSGEKMDTIIRMKTDGITVCKNIQQCYQNSPKEWASFATIETNAATHEKITREKQRTMDKKSKIIKLLISEQLCK